MSDARFQRWSAAVKACAAPAFRTSARSICIRVTTPAITRVRGRFTYCVCNLSDGYATYTAFRDAGLIA